MRGAELGVLIVGCGAIGDNHVRAIAEVDGLCVVAFVDPDGDRRANLARTVEALGGVRPAEFSSLESALTLSTVDLVSICTPSGLHIRLATEAINAGKHVLIEKPLDVNLVRAVAFAGAVREAEARGQVISVVSQHRFDESSARVHTAIAAGEFGRLTSGVASIAWWREQSYYDSAEWRGTWALDGGGAAMNQGIHTIDLLLWYLGTPLSISASTALLAHTGIEVEDTLVSTIVFESGALGVVHATTAAYPGVAASLSIYGSAGSAVIQNDELTFLETERTEPASNAPSPSARASIVGGPGSGHAAQYADILEAIVELREPLVTVTDALLALATVTALYAAAETGSPVRLADLLADPPGVSRIES